MPDLWPLIRRPIQRGLLAGALLMAAATQSLAVQSVLPEAQLRGEATFRYLGFALYQARLFTPEGAPLDWDAEFALELTYLRDVSAEDLVNGTLTELERTGSALPRREALAACFDDVTDGDRYAAITRGPDRILFLRNGSAACTLDHPGIKTGFMAIFLGENTRSGRFTRQLLGE